ncbi:MAG: P-loop NTPase [Propionibacteriales bacterium]|nr:P-loop NTPase [Propionibacteriales bacterium]
MITVVTAAAGEAWESAAVQNMEATPDLHLGRRCVDVPDLLVMAAANNAQIALVSLALPGLDADTIYRLGQHQIRVVAVVESTAAHRAHALGIGSTIGPHDLDGLATFLAGLSMPNAVGPETVAATADEAGTVLAVWGPAGAPGRSTVALNLACEFAALGHQTLLIDADPYGGAIAQMLGVLDEVSGLLAASRAANAGTLESVAEFAYRVGDNLALLTGLPRAALWAQLRGGAIDSLFARARAESQVVVVDCGFSLESAEILDSGAPRRNQLTLQAAENADRLVVVGTADPVGLTRLARGIHELREAVPDALFDVVINRHRPEMGWSTDQVSDTLHRLTRMAPIAFLPNDQRATDRALMTGRSLLEAAPDAPVVRAIRKLASKLESNLVQPAQ